jgi:hypothetical protein
MYHHVSSLTSHNTSRTSKAQNDPARSLFVYVLWNCGLCSAARTSYNKASSRSAEPEVASACAVTMAGTRAAVTRYGVSSGSGWRNGLQYGDELRMYSASSRGQQTRGGTPARGLGDVLTTPFYKILPRYVTLYKSSDFDPLVQHKT